MTDPVTPAPPTPEDRAAELLAIVAAVTAHEPYFPHEGQSVCALCDSTVSEAVADEYSQHHPSCPYRRAGEFVATFGADGPLPAASRGGAFVRDTEAHRTAAACCSNCFGAYIDALPADAPFSLRFLHGMFLCSQCGNKRCPSATDHQLACSGSNALGQLGSATTAAPADGHP